MDLPNAKYGENSQFQSLQQGASLSASPSPMGQGSPSSPQSLPPNPAAGNVIPFSAPTNRPGEPVTSGATLGAGPGVGSLGLQPSQVEKQDIGKISSALPFYQMVANMNNASQSTRMLVNILQSGGQ